jgi:hypothetical protein
MEFLTIDHPNGDGAAHRRRLKGTRNCTDSVYHDLKKRGFPVGEVRVLCWNCNCARGFFGYCPREKQNKGQYREFLPPPPIKPGKLTESDRAEIRLRFRKAYNRTNAKDLATEFGVSTRAIYQLVYKEEEYEHARDQEATATSGARTEGGIGRIQSSSS